MEFKPTPFILALQSMIKAGEIDKVKIQSMLDNKQITQEEYDYIINKN